MQFTNLNLLKICIFGLISEFFFYFGRKAGNILWQKFCFCKEIFFVCLFVLFSYVNPPFPMKPHPWQKTEKNWLSIFPSSGFIWVHVYCFINFACWSLLLFSLFLCLFPFVLPTVSLHVFQINLFWFKIKFTLFFYLHSKFVNFFSWNQNGLWHFSAAIASNMFILFYVFYFFLETIKERENQ